MLRRYHVLKWYQYLMEIFLLEVPCEQVLVTTQVRISPLDTGTTLNTHNIFNTSFHVDRCQESILTQPYPTSCQTPPYNSVHLNRPSPWG